MLAYITSKLEVPEQLKALPKNKLCRREYKNGAIYTHINAPSYEKMPERLINVSETLNVFKLSETLDQKRITKRNIGTPFIMGDGQSWLIPKLRVFPDGSQLPSSLKLTENGMQYIVKPDVLEAWATWELIWDHVFSDKKMDDAQIIDVITKVLQINYDITSLDILVFGLLDESLGNIFNHLIDLDAYLKHFEQSEPALKKNA
jgi:hypothetical protein